MIKKSSNISPEEYIMMVATRLEAVANRYVLHPMNMSFMTVKILSYLSCAKKATPTEMMNAIGGTKSNISQRLNHLEKEGCIAREFATFSDDKRKIVVRVTDKGKKTLKEVTKRLEKARSLLKAGFTEKELKANADFCIKMIRIINSPDSELKNIFQK